MFWLLVKTASLKSRIFGSHNDRNTKPYKLFYFRINPEKDTLFKILKSSLEPSISVHLEGEKTITLKLERSFSDIKERGDEIWGKFTFDLDESTQDSQGKFYSAKQTYGFEFVIIQGSPDYLIVFSKGKLAKNLIQLLNSKLNPKAPIIRPFTLTGMNFKEFIQKNPCDNLFAWMPIADKGARMFGASGENLSQSERYNLLLAAATDLETATLMIYEYQWVVSIAKSGSINDLSNANSADFVKFIRDKILSLS